MFNSVKNISMVKMNIQIFFKKLLTLKLSRYHLLHSYIMSPRIFIRPCTIVKNKRLIFVSVRDHLLKRLRMTFESIIGKSAQCIFKYDRQRMQSKREKKKEKVNK